jgi:hypothetical protein
VPGSSMRTSSAVTASLMALCLLAPAGRVARLAAALTLVWRSGTAQPLQRAGDASSAELREHHCCDGCIICLGGRRRRCLTHRAMRVGSGGMWLRGVAACLHGAATTTGRFRLEIICNISKFFIGVTCRNRDGQAACGAPAEEDPNNERGGAVCRASTYFRTVYRIWLISQLHYGYPSCLSLNPYW